MTTVPRSTQDNGSQRALWWGVLFSFIFTGLIWLLQPLLPEIDLLPDAGAAWYYWKLPEPTVMSRVAVWTGYLLHQVAIWGTIYYAQSRRLKYTKGLHRVNVIALGLNALFIVLHMVQTYIWYDGLAQDVSVFSSQGSVIILLVLVLHMENQRRGLFFGQKLGFLNETGRVVRQYHGYVFTWAIIYTFWFHPTVATAQHLGGFLYTFLLMLQGALMFTRAHLNKYWTVALELGVLVHGTMVAYLHQQAWTMFFFGFAGLFVITQMHGLGLSRRLRWFFLATYVAGVVVTYSLIGWDRLSEIVRIPLIEYLLVFAFAGIIWLGMKLVSLFKRSSPTNIASAD